MLSLWKNYVDLVNFSVDPGFGSWVDYWNTQGPFACFFGVCMLCAAFLVPSCESERLYWLHSLVLVLFQTAFGASLCDLFLGNLPCIITLDYIVGYTVVAWYLTHYSMFSKIFRSKPALYVWTVLCYIGSANSIANYTKLASNSITQPRAIYPIPIVGPVVIGTTLVSFFMFLPLNIGLAPISKSTPFPIQGGVISSAFFHFMIDDKTGFIGNLLRNIVGTFAEREVIAIISVFWIVAGVGQIYLNDFEFNPFSIIVDILWNSFSFPEFRKKGKNETGCKNSLRSGIVWLCAWYVRSMVMTAVAISFYKKYHS